MGFYNVQQGDVPYFKQLADTYSMSDNFHQSVNGGTGANHIMLGNGDAIWFSDGNGNPLTPPHNHAGGGGNPTPGSSTRSRTPNPLQGHQQLVHRRTAMAAVRYGAASYGGGSYSDCSDTSQPAWRRSSPI